MAIEGIHESVVRHSRADRDTLAGMWRRIAAANITVAQSPVDLVGRLRKATDPRLFPPSHRWSPPGLYLAGADAQGTQFQILYVASRVRFRVTGTAHPIDNRASLVSMVLFEDSWDTSIAVVCALAGIAVLALAWSAKEARFLGAWLLFMAAVAFAHQRTARRHARTMVDALSSFWNGNSGVTIPAGEGRGV